MKETILIQQKIMEWRIHKIKKEAKPSKKFTWKNTQQYELDRMKKEAKWVQSKDKKCKAQHLEEIRRSDGRKIDIYHKKVHELKVNTTLYLNNKWYSNN